MSGLSKKDGKSSQTFSISNTYIQNTPPTYQDFTGQQNYDEGDSTDGEIHWAATSIVDDDTGYIQSFNHDNEPGFGNEATANSSWPTHPVIPSYPLALCNNLTSPFNVGVTSTPILGAPTSTSIAEVDHCTHTLMRYHENTHIADLSLGGNETQSSPSYFSSGDIPASNHSEHVVPRDRVHCTWPDCTKTFGRLQELTRHHNSVHELTTSFWCPVSACNRSEGFPGRKPPFTRKDKLKSHMRIMHRLNLSRAMMAGVQAGLAAGGSGNADAEGSSCGSDFNTANGFYDVGAPPILDDHSLSNGLADFVDPIGGYEPLDFDGVSNAGWFNNVDSVSSFNEFPSPNQTDIPDFDSLTAADSISDEQNIPGEDILFSGNGCVDTL
ncbi:hypothetical protein COCCADRAFT_103506 [Bipolaris zeicola 26-R-13]|uniref:C2H2-type domain-containing protein n=1 Tax=Cochliobolus carbonum (strain 26-R-13) TaxID=930089 RepID=W6XSP6_COCC2|nr:uncharacterized protein COCCADRAFT_103506 [Bipolaris zeicola 26-R-13]EUC30607.1 hypothetical protein COCCADRAFT_103506 [Bipolaris zeicola 26-R-13]